MKTMHMKHIRGVACMGRRKQCMGIRCEGDHAQTKDASNVPQMRKVSKPSP